MSAAQDSLIVALGFSDLGSNSGWMGTVATKSGQIVGKAKTLGFDRILMRGALNGATTPGARPVLQR